MSQSRETMKYVVVTGGVLSGLGKGISTSSIGVLLKSRGLKVSPIKIDPYLNVDAGTMNPYQHGEVFVLDDGAEVDLDLGNYERTNTSPCWYGRSEEHTSELQSRENLVCRLLLEKKK